MRTGCNRTRFGNEAKTIIQGDALTELKSSPPKASIWSLPTHRITSVKILMVWSKPGKKICLSTGCLKWLQSAIIAFWKKQGSMYIMNSTENMPLSISSAASFYHQKSHRLVMRQFWSAGEKTLRLRVRTHPDDGERRKELHVQRWCYSVEAKTGSQRVDQLSQNPPQPYNHQKYRVTSGIFRACVIWWMNMKTTWRKTGSLVETHYSRLLPTQAISFSTCRR